VDDDEFTPDDQDSRYCITGVFLALLTSRSAFGYRNAADAAIMPG
jgi:hypothetical protein